MPLGLGHLAGGKPLHPGNYIDWTKRWGRSGFVPFDLLGEPSEKDSSHPRTGSKPQSRAFCSNGKSAGSMTTQGTCIIKFTALTIHGL